MLNRHVAVVCFFIIFSKSLYANLIQWDAFDAGDELAVKDESTGLIWLDLSLTANVHYDDAGSLFDGWSYAGYGYVESLLDDVFFDINISGELGEQSLFEQKCVNTSNCYSSSVTWQKLFGSTVGSRYYQTHSFGLYKDQEEILRMGGAYLNGTGSANRYGVDFNANYTTHYDTKFSNNKLKYFSTYLIKNESLPRKVDQISVGEPSNRYIFALVLCLVWMVRRNLFSQKAFKNRG